MRPPATPVPNKGLQHRQNRPPTYLRSAFDFLVVSACSRARHLRRPICRPIFLRKKGQRHLSACFSAPASPAVSCSAGASPAAFLLAFCGLLSIPVGDVAKPTEDIALDLFPSAAPPALVRSEVAGRISATTFKRCPPPTQSRMGGTRVKRRAGLSLMLRGPRHICRRLQVPSGICTCHPGWPRMALCMRQNRAELAELQRPSCWVIPPSCLNVCANLVQTVAGIAPNWVELGSVWSNSANELKESRRTSSRSSFGENRPRAKYDRIRPNPDGSMPNLAVPSHLWGIMVGVDQPTLARCW